MHDAKEGGLWAQVSAVLHVGTGVKPEKAVALSRVLEYRGFIQVSSAQSSGPLVSIRGTDLKCVMMDGPKRIWRNHGFSH